MTRRTRLHVEALDGRCLPSFSPITSYSAGSSPQALATADFNNDGRLDLAVAKYSKVSVFLNDGEGGFGTPQEFATGWWDISSIAAADFNGDTKLDIVAAHLNGFSILMGNGDGTLQSAVTTHSGDGTGFAIGDFNNDSNTDLMVSWYNGDWMRRYTVHLGNGEGYFVGLWDDYLPAEGRLAAVDFSNSGSLDVATADGQVLLGQGGGIFNFPYGQQPLLNVRYDAAVTPGDFNGDGNADLVSVSDSVAILRSRGDGGFYPPIFHSANGTTLTAVATADFDADGKLDAIVTDGDKATVSVMLGNGDGTLRLGGAFATGTSPSAVAVGDFNADGRPDAVVANRGSGTVSVLLNDGDWAAVPPPPLTLSVADATVTEGDVGTANATFTVTLTRPSAVDVTVSYVMANITATAAADYVAAPGTLTIPAGQTTGTFIVAIRGDRIAEPTETFAVYLSSSTNAAIADAEGLCTVVDNEPRISIGDVTRAEGGKGQKTSFTFTVTLSVAYDQAVTMSFRTVNGTATTSDNDYFARTSTLTFAPGETSKTITIEVKGDSKKEANETFYLDLFGLSSNGLFTKSRGVGTILNDD